MVHSKIESLTKLKLCVHLYVLTGTIVFNNLVRKSKPESGLFEKVTIIYIIYSNQWMIIISHTDGAIDNQDKFKNPKQTG